MGLRKAKLIKDYEIHPGNIKKKGIVLTVDNIKYRELLRDGFIRGTVSDKVKKILKQK